MRYLKTVRNVFIVAKCNCGHKNAYQLKNYKKWHSYNGDLELWFESDSFRCHKCGFIKHAT